MDTYLLMYVHNICAQESRNQTFLLKSMSPHYKQPRDHTYTYTYIHQTFAQKKAGFKCLVKEHGPTLEEPS